MMYQPSRDEFERHRMRLPEQGTESYVGIVGMFTATRPRAIMREWGGFTYVPEVIDVWRPLNPEQVVTEWGKSWGNP